MTEHHSKEAQQSKQLTVSGDVSRKIPFFSICFVDAFVYQTKR